MDERPPPLRLVYADELGQLKVVQTADGAQLGTAAVAATWGAPDKQQCVDCLALGSAGGIEDTATAVLAVARRGGTVELLSPLTGEALGSIPPAEPDPKAAGGKAAEEAARVRGLHLLWGGADAGGGALPAVLSVTQGGAARVHAPLPEGGWEQRRAWQVPPQVCCTAFDPASGRLAVGCEGAELRLFDAATGQLAFTFKGGKPNKVGLVDKPWNTAIAFLPPADSSGEGVGEGSGGQGGGSGGGSSEGKDAPGASGSRLLVGTGYHKVRLYDASAGKRPQLELTWGESRVTSLALEPDGRRCWVGNGLGQVEVLDLQTRRFSGAVKGLSGSARALAVHPGGAMLASAGLDRYLRLNSCASRQLLAKLYLKTQPTCIAFCPTDVSMLPPAAQQEPQAAGKKQRRRRRQQAEGSDEEAEERQAGSDQGGSGDEAEDDGSGSEDSEQERQRRRKEQKRRRKSGKQRGDGGGGRRQRAGGDED